jgi:protein tyrosine phosphatase (PTP) superfamily phosphohydrolase (DUF442 family)
VYHGDLTAGGSRLAAWWDSVVFDHAFFRIFWSNWGEVIPGKLYRSNHPTPAGLAAVVARRGIKTIVNLRGKRACGTDQLARIAGRDLGLAQIDLGFESRGAPHRDRILRFAKYYRTMAFPALMHCKSGADRAGLGAGLAILIEGGTSAQASRQLSLRFLHFGRSPTGILDAFLHLYRREAEGRMPFLEWVEHHYDEDRLRATFKSHGLSRFINDRLLHRE